MREKNIQLLTSDSSNSLKSPPGLIHWYDIHRPPGVFFYPRPSRYTERAGAQEMILFPQVMMNLTTNEMMNMHR